MGKMCIQVLRRLLLLSLAGYLLSLAGCFSGSVKRYRDFRTAPLSGMVYDHDNQPCAGVRVFVNGREGPKSDINGRFVINGMSKGKHEILVLKEGYEEQEINFDFADKSQVLYIRIISFNQLLRKVERALAAKRFQEAKMFLDRAEAINDGDPVGLYLKAVYLFETEAIEKSVQVLESILDKGYREAAILLTLADIYQFHLQDSAAARRYLEQYLRIQRDPQVQERLNALAQ